MQNIVTSVREEMVEEIGVQTCFEDPAKEFAGGWRREKDR